MNDRSQTPAEISDQLSGDGFDGQFMPSGGDGVRCLSCRKTFSAASAAAESIGRTEGESDPDDETAVVAITCPECHTKGTMALKYGATASSDEADILLALQS